MKYWAYETNKYPLYKFNLLPGWKEGYSSSMLGGLDVGITRHITKERIEAAAKVVEFMLLKEEQKKLILKEKTFTGIKDLYYDDDVCSTVNCDIYRNLQLNSRYQYERKDFSTYSTKFLNYVYDFINGNKTATEALNRINDLTYIYEINISGKDHAYGLILFIIVIILSLVVMGSCIFFHIERFKSSFQYLPIDFWYVILLGILCHLASNFTDYGEVLPFKCRLKIFLYSIGYTLIFIPFLYKLVINFPVENKISRWVSNKRYIFLLSFVCCDVALFLINFGSTYNIKTLTPDNGKRYQECKMDTLSKAILYLTFGFKIVISIIIGILSFVEWNMKDVALFIRITVSSIYINILSIGVILILKFIIFDNYITYSVLNKIFIFIIILSNYFTFIGTRIIFGFIDKKEEDPFSNIANFKVNNNQNDSFSISSQRTESSDNLSTKISTYQKIVSYHYKTNSSSTTLT